MIVDPDFPDHWKTRMLVNSLSDEAAPVYLLRLWAHCQNRRASTFMNFTDEALKAVCRYQGHANKLASSLAASGFVRREGESLVVCGWDERNAKLIAARGNGQKGGRPKKPNDNPQETQPKPTDNQVEKRREDETREENLALGDKATFLTGPSERTNEFWDKYPKKTQFGQLQNALDASVAEVVGTRGCTDEQAFAWLLVACREYAASPAGKDPASGSDRRPAPAKWLLDKRYLDDRKTWSVPNGDNPRSREPTKPKFEPLRNSTLGDDLMELMK